jgi:enamine deaminase RidA (YjgF/YER057c/UK114 family)
MIEARCALTSSDLRYRAYSFAPLNLDGTTVAPGDVTVQASKCVANLIVALEAAGATLSDAIYTRVLVASSKRTDLVEAWTVVSAAFGDHDVPSTLTGVTVLGYANQLVEIECVAAIAN